ncbi:MAG: hypothetical protein HY778_17360 [Betaproteobacteria bacterium]|nr:hypothetical protein [Betaproteobacteria bacterium]
MLNRTMMTTALASTLALSAGLFLAADQAHAQARAQAQDTQQIYGSQLMTQQERNEYRAKMRTATTAEAREQVRLEHHESMKARAAERGVTLPDEPPARGGGRGMGPGGGAGPGMGPGGGIGPGGGRNR